MAHKSLFDRNSVIKFLRENTEMSNQTAADFLTSAGSPISKTTIADIRRQHHIPYKPKQSAKIIVDQLHAKGVKITMELLKSRWPDMTIAYAQKLVATYEPEKRVLKKTQPIEVEIETQKYEKPFLVTKIGHVTRYEFR